MESNVDNSYFIKESDSKPVSLFSLLALTKSKHLIEFSSRQAISSSVSLDTATTMLENGASCGLPLSKQKRMRTLMRQERVTRKEGDVVSGVESERASPIIQTLQSILPKYVFLNDLGAEFYKLYEYA